MVNVALIGAGGQGLFNLRSLFHLTQLALPSLTERKGNIVNVSSVTGTRAFPGVLARTIAWTLKYIPFNL